MIFPFFHVLFLLRKPPYFPVISNYLSTKTHGYGPNLYRFSDSFNNKTIILLLCKVAVTLVIQCWYNNGMKAIVNPLSNIRNVYKTIHSVVSKTIYTTSTIIVLTIMICNDKSIYVAVFATMIE